MSRHKKLMTRPRKALSGLLAATVIATGAGFLYIAAPWSPSTEVQEIKPVPFTNFEPAAEEKERATTSGDGSNASAFSDTGSSPVRVGRVPMAPVAANDNGAGNFAAPPGSSSGSWGTPGQTGSFTWNYPFALREAPAGPTPTLGLSYDSSRVDGLTSATNNQATEVGDGWALTGTGTIRQQFGSCKDQGAANSYDLCGKKEGQAFSISFGSRSGEVIMDEASKRFKLRNDDNTKVEYLTGAANGTFDGGYWRLTDTSGTQYWFGVNRIPGWSPGKENNSADIVPVYGLPGQPCYKSTGFGDSSCMQAYAWNLDYVVDANGNSQGFFYTQDTNFYKSQAGSGTLKAYHRASRLTRVDYGMRAGTELTTQAPLHVNFGYTARCSGVDCSKGTDVPADKACTSTATTCTVQSPMFYTDQRLITAISQALSINPAGYGDLDYWTLRHTMPDPGDGTKPALWLSHVIHQGTNRTSTDPGTTWITDPATSFDGLPRPNRVWDVRSGQAPLNRYRLLSIVNPTGATTTINYAPPECTEEDVDKDGNADIVPENNTKRCFPQWWAPTTPIPEVARMDYFHIYPVTSVFTDPGPGTNGTLDLVTNYTYEGTPAWKYAAPKYINGTGGSQLTWSVLAGWSKVKTTLGTDAAKPTTVSTYLRGLDGTPSNTSGGLRSVTVTASDGVGYTDSPWFAGSKIEEQSLLGDGGALLGKTINVPWASAPTATASAALGGTQAKHIGIARVKTMTASSKSAALRTNVTNTTFDALGRPTSVSDNGEESVSGDETCTITSYADNPAANLLALPATVKKFAGECPSTGALLTAAQTVYDNSTTAEPGSPGYSAPTKGNAVRADTATSVSGTSVTVWKQGPVTGYDPLGRATTSTDNSTGTPRTTTTTYLPTTGLATTVKVVNHKRWESITTLDSMRGLPLTESDENQSVTSYRYDASGRVTGEWSPLRPKASNAAEPSTETSYSISNTSPSWVKTTTRASNNWPVDSYIIYDGLGKVRQTQKMSPGGGTIATDIWYDSRGDKSKVNNNYYLAPAPDGVLKLPTIAVPSTTQYEYDAAQRPTAVRALANDNDVLWTGLMSYQGADTATVTGPGSEAATTTIKNLGGKVESRKLFHGPTATGNFDESRYGYDALGQLISMKDTANNAWSWTFDAAGREIQANDPDAGVATSTYDASGRKATTTDASGSVIGYVYDDMDRVLKKTVGTGAGVKTLEEFVYDLEIATAKGQLSKSTRFNGPNLDQPVTTTFSGYDAAYQPRTSVVTLPPAFGALYGTYTTDRTYSKTGKVFSENLPYAGGLAGETLSYGYDTLDNPSSVQTQAGEVIAGNTQYGHLGNLATFKQYDANTTGTGDTTGTNQTFFTWDATTGRLTNQRSSNLTRGVDADLGTVRYTYNPAGKITSRELAFTSRPGNTSDYQCYSYDHASRIAAVWTPAPTPTTNCSAVPSSSATNIPGLGGPAAYAQTYTYTQAGDRSQVKRFGSNGAVAMTENYSYPAAGSAGPHRVKQIISTPPSGSPVTQDFTWDAAGRMTNRARQVLTYTPDGRMSTTTGASVIPANPNPGAAAATPPTPTSTITNITGNRYYDANGNLVGIIDGTGTTVTIGSVTAHLSAASPGVQTATRTYTFAGKTVAQRTRKPGTTPVIKLAFLIGDSVNTTQTMISPTTGTGPITTLTRYTDPLGLTRGSNGTATGNTAYSAAGASSAGVGSNASSQSGFGATNGYISGLDDAASSLTHLGARELDPVAGTFTSPDPILNTEDQRGFTPYTYAFGNVINTSDPTGLKPTCDCDDDSKGTYAPGPGGYGKGLNYEYADSKPTSPIQPPAQQINPFTGKPYEPQYNPWAKGTGKQANSWTLPPASAFSYRPASRIESRVNVWSLFALWGGNFEERKFEFQKGDPFTEDVRNSEYYRNLYSQISAEMKAGTYNDTTYLRSFGEEGGAVFFQDVQTVLTLGANGGSLSLTYLGSHTIKTNEEGKNSDGSTTIRFRAINNTTLESATRFPFFDIGYQEWYRNSVGAYWNWISETSTFGRRQDQEVTWTENIR